ncbi:MAG: iron-containing alcohol dehydrogenase, partial [Erysipelotrichaceae bacterium]|nr:iron-containing alcohol dehydrogenase [Erysipelotrichaceae bacterium]
DATHGMTLAAVSIPYYKHILADGLDKFKRFAINVWNVNPDNKTDIEIANEGLFYLENFMKELGLVMNIKELGVTESMINDIASKSFILEGGFKKLSYDEIVGILKASM